MQTGKRLYRAREERMFLGVLGGVAHYLDLDPTVVRLAFILLSLTPFPGLIAYLILALVVPREPAIGFSGERPRRDSFDTF